MERGFLSSLLRSPMRWRRATGTGAATGPRAAVARGLALASGLTSPAAETVAQAGRLHDLGKIGVPESVLGKAGPLSDEEWAVMRLHPLTGAQILAPWSSSVMGCSSSGIITSGLTGAAIPTG